MNEASTTIDEIISEKYVEGVKIQEAKTDSQLKACYPLFKELRPHIKGEQNFISQWNKQVDEGYIISFVEITGNVVAAVGYRLMTTMAWGRFIYIDDLIALPDQCGRGYGTLLLKHIQNKAVKLNLKGVHLDTGYQRHLAHNSYLRNGFKLNCHHLCWINK